MNLENVQLFLEQECKHQRQEMQVHSKEFVNNLLTSSEESHFLQFKTFHDIQHDVTLAIRTFLSHIYTSEESISCICKRLRNYRWVDTLDQIVPGRYIQMIRVHHQYDRFNLQGGFVLNVSFRDNCTFVSILRNRKCLNCKFDNFIWFHKLNNSEKLLLFTNEEINRLTSESN